MTRRAVVIGATGQIGRAAVRALARDGWEVTAASRGGGRDDGWPAEVRTAALDREDDAALAAAVGDGCDVLVDMVAYGAGHARQLTGLADRVGSAVVISSGVGVRGRPGAAASTPSPSRTASPRIRVPIPESQRTVRPARPRTAPARSALERELLAAGDRLPTTLLRAGAIHGPYCRTPRELYVVKRSSGRPPRRVLAYGGASRFHPVQRPHPRRADPAGRRAAGLARPERVRPRGADRRGDRARPSTR